MGKRHLYLLWIGAVCWVLLLFALHAGYFAYYHESGSRTCGIRTYREERVQVHERVRRLRNTLPRRASLSQEWRDSDDKYTQARCFELADMSGACEYRNLFYDGERIYLVSPTADYLPSYAAGKEFERMGHEDCYQLQRDFPIPLMNRVPYADNEISREARLVSPAWLQENSKDFVSLPGMTYITHPAHVSSNPFYFAKENQMLWEMEWMYSTHPLMTEIPSMDNLIIGRDEVPEGWPKGMMEFYLRNQSNALLILSRDLVEKGVGKKRFAILEK